jgi:L-fucose isomerase-like protein
MTQALVKIGYVPTYRHFGPIPAWSDKMRKEGLEALREIPGVQVIAPEPCPEDPTRIDAQKGYIPDGAVWNFEQAEALAEYFTREKVDALVIAALDFGDERSSAKVAEKLGVPVLLYATREPPVPAGPSLARVSDSYCGTLSIASALYRRKLPFYYAGIFYAGELEFCQEVEKFVRAVSVVKALKGARIAQVGLRPATFETVGYDEVAMIRKFGQNLIYADLSEIVNRAKALPDDDPHVQERITSIRGEVAEITVSDEWLLKAAKMEQAAAEFWQRNGLSAMAMQCWPTIQNMWGFSTCALFGRLTGQGMLTACEADIIGSLSMLVNYAASLHETVPHFIDWTIQHRENENRFLSWHCGNAPACLADDKRRAAIRSRRDMAGELPSDPDDTQAGLYQFQIRPGKVTFCRLAEYDGQWKMLIASGEIIPSEETLAGTWSWVEVKDHRKLYRTLVEEGFIHHASMVHGDQVEVLKLACKFLDIQAVVVE